MKILIYSNPELYENSSYEGRAEAHLIAYNTSTNIDETTVSYKIIKDRYSLFFNTSRLVSLREIKYAIRAYDRATKTLIGV